MIRFDFVTEVGKAKVEVDMNNKTKDGRPIAGIRGYTVLGHDIEDDDIADVYREGMRRLVSSVREFLAVNNWCLYMY